MNIMLVAEFLEKSDLKKITVGCYFWTSLLFMKWEVPNVISDETFGDLATLIIFAVFFSNVATHFIKHKYGGGNGNGNGHMAAPAAGAPGPGGGPASAPPL